MPITIHIPQALQRLTQGRAAIIAEASTPRDALAHLGQLYPGTQNLLLNARGELRRFITVCRRHAQGCDDIDLDTSLHTGDELSFSSALLACC